MDANHDRLAYRLADAWVSGSTIPLPDAAAAPATRMEAYAIEDRMADLIGERVVGWKVGASVKAVQFFEGHDGPIPGRVFADRSFETEADLPAALFNGAKVECEFACRLTEALGADTGPVAASELIDKVSVHPAIELAATRYAPGTGGRAMNTFDGIADNGTAGAVVLGSAFESWQDLLCEAMPIDARIDDSPPIQAYSGIYRRNPVEIMAETLTDLHERGVKFQKDMFLLTGSSTLPTPIRKGQTLTARFGDFSPLVLTLN